jgi:hypothetical protein
MRGRAVIPKDTGLTLPGNSSDDEISDESVDEVELTTATSGSRGGEAVLDEAARTWAGRWYPHREPSSVLHLYNLVAARDRASWNGCAETEAMARKRLWCCSISDIALTIGELGEVGDYFITVNLPYDFTARRVANLARPEGRRRGNQRWDTGGSEGHAWNSPLVVGAVPGVPHHFYDVSHSFDLGKPGPPLPGPHGSIPRRCNPRGNTPGLPFDSCATSYFDLYEKTLHVELWRGGDPWIPNSLVVAADVPLVDVVRGRPTRVIELTRPADPTRRVAPFLHGKVLLTVTLQESTDFHLAPKKWRAALSEVCLNERLCAPGERRRIEPRLTLTLASAQPRILAFPHTFSAAQRQIATTGSVISIHRALKRSISRMQKREFVSTFDFGEGAGMFFRGTNAHLEACAIKAHITGYDYDNPLGRIQEMPVAETEIALRGSIELGHVQGAMGYDYLFGRAGEGAVCGGGKQDMGLEYTGTIAGEVDVTVVPKDADIIVRAQRLEHEGDAPGTQRNVLRALSRRETRLWRSYVQVGEARNSTLFDHLNESYLCVRIKTVRFSSVTHEAGVGSVQEGRISVAGSWCGQVQRTAHGDVKGYSCGFDHETLYFVIRKFGAHPTCDEVAAHPVARLIVWGEEQGGRRTTLGRASIFLHQITGHLGGGATACAGHEPCSHRRLERVNIVKRRKKFPWTPLSGADEWETQTKRTRVYRDSLPLRSQANEAIGSIDIEAFFRCPTDHERVEANSKLQVMDLFDFERNSIMMLPHWSEESERTKNKLCVCNIPSMSLPSNVTKCRLALEGGICQTVATFQTWVEAHTSIDTDTRTEREMGLEGALYAVERKTALGKQVVPCSGYIDDPSCDRHWSRLVCLDETNTPRFFPTFLLPTAMPRGFWINESERLLRLDAAPGASFLHPQVAFEMMQYVRRIPFGAIVDTSDDAQHSGGTQKNLYAEAKPVQSPNHFLMKMCGGVREHALLLCNYFLGAGFDAYVCIGEVNTVGEAGTERQGKPISVEHMWVMTREVPMGGKKKHKTAFGTVRFWELSSGEVYYLPHRFLPIGIAAKVHESVEREEYGKRQKTTAELLNSVKDRSSGRRCEETAVLGFVDEMTHDACAEHEVFISGVGSGDKWGVLTESAAIREFNAERVAERAQKEAIAVETRRMKVKQVRQSHSMEMRLRQIEAAETPELPYTKLHVVFNHEDLWVNCQRHPETAIRIDDPAKMNFELATDDPRKQVADHNSMGWVRFRSETRGGAGMRCHYSKVPYTPVKAPDAVAALEETITKDLEVSLEGLRRTAYRVEFHKVASTTIVRQMRTMLVMVLEAKERLGTLYPGEISPSGTAVPEPPTTAVDAMHARANEKLREMYCSDERQLREQETRRLKALLSYYTALNHLKQTCPLGYGFRLMFFAVNSDNVDTIRKAVLDREFAIKEPLVTELRKDLSRKLYLMGTHIRESSKMKSKEMFAIGVKVFPSYNAVMVTRVAVMCVFPQ